MKYEAVQKNTRQTPRKIRLVANQVKGLPLEQALRQLAVINRRSTLVLLKVFKQAIANAKNNHGVLADRLEIDAVMITEGPRYRRFQAVSRGRAHGIIKRTSHVKVVLRDKAQTAEASTKEAPAKKASVAKKATTATKTTKESKSTTAKSSKKSK